MIMRNEESRFPLVDIEAFWGRSAKVMFRRKCNIEMFIHRYHYVVKRSL
jgi:hypothetical protein